MFFEQTQVAQILIDERRYQLKFASSALSVFPKICFLIIAILLSASPLQAQIFCGGDGAEATPYEICDAVQLAALATEINTGGDQTVVIYYILMEDIDLSGYSDEGWTPIGNDDHPFQGYFDGNGKVVRNLFINREADNQGLFGCIDEATIKNLGVEKCHVSGDNFVGGLVGRSNASTITDCYTEGAITGAGHIGGLVGWNIATAISNSYVMGNVTGNDNVGGLVGMSHSDAIISTCYATGAVEGNDNVGGLVGDNGYNATIVNCVAANESVIAASATTFVNRVAGKNDGFLINNYAFKEMIVLSDGVEVLPNDDLNTESGEAKPLFTLTDFEFYNTATHWNTQAWNIAAVEDPSMAWMICNGLYLPFLQWQETFTCTPVIIATAGVGGSIAPAGETPVIFATDQTFNFGANPLYEVVQLLVDDESVADSIAGGSYTFKQVFTNHTIHVSFQLTTGFCGGNGTEAHPYEICTAEELADLALIANAGGGNQTEGIYYILMNDIDLNAYTSDGGWMPINDFQGSFDGNGKEIRNLTINRTGVTGDNQGLFGLINGATIKNLGIKNCNIKARNRVGGLAGYIVANSHIENCYVAGAVNGNNDVGGLVGHTLSSGSIKNCYAACNVTGDGTGIGGLIGDNNAVTIENCYATENVTGSDQVGGLVGNNSALIKNCVAANTSVVATSATTFINRIAGNNDATLQNNYAFEDITVLSNGVAVSITAGLNTPAGEDKSFLTLKQVDFYNTATHWDTQAWSIAAGSDATKIWNICDGLTFPFFQWQEDVVCPPLFCGGAGTAEDPYQICTAEGLVELADLTNADGAQTAGIYYKLMSNINLSGYASGEGWMPIGNNITASNATRFQGIFDGNNKIITGLAINRQENNYQGLFGYTQGATIKNLGIVNCNIAGGEYVGGLAGFNDDSIIEKCYSAGTVSGIYYIGGLIGWNNNATITNSYTTGTTTGSIGNNGHVGGLVGWNDNSTIANCYATGYVTGNSPVGGLAGNNKNISTIVNCYATGTVTGNNNVGGLAGTNNDYSIIKNCYATGNVTGNDRVGGLTGTNGDYSTIERCYATGPVTGIINVGGLTGRNSYSVIENCYAIENVTGNLYVGGLLGSNSYATVNNCYATGNITGNDRAGGLVGENSNSSTIKNSYAFNCKIETITGSDVGRMIGWMSETSILTNNYAYSQMELWATGVKITSLNPPSAHNNIHGANISFNDAITPATYTAWLTPAPSAWKMKPYEPLITKPETNLPILSAFTSSVFPLAIQEPQIIECNAPPTFCGGTGTPTNPYLICNAEQLDLIRNHLDKHFKLSNDIHLSTYLAPDGEGHKKWGTSGWEPIGDNITPFTGSLNGDGHRIIGLWINRTGNYIGLFGFIDGAVIRNVGVIISD